MSELIDAGARDAQRWIDRHPRFWCTDGSRDLGMRAPHAETAREQQLLDEYRAMRRR